MEELLTPATLPAYVASLGLFPEGAPLTASEISGGNLNYSFRVSHPAAGPGTRKEVFVKQTPGHVKVLGPSAALSNRRLLVERHAYAEWAAITGASACLPTILHFDEERMVLVMEFLDSHILLHDQLFAVPSDFDAPSPPDSSCPLCEIATAAGSFLGAVHGATHSSNVSEERAAELTAAFANAELRGVQLEYVFSKCYREAEGAASLRDDSAFMAEVEALKSLYMGEVAEGGLALCHGDCHPGSLMVDYAASSIKLIDPEFAIYGPPGLDIGCCLSGFALAALFHHTEGRKAAVARLVEAIGALWRAYTSAMATQWIGRYVLTATAADAMGFLGCEVARTALGFAGVRGLPIKDESMKKEAEAVAVSMARACILGRREGINVLVDFLQAL